MESDRPEPGEARMLEVVRRQRDQALACAFLSFAITLALILSNFGSETMTDRQIQTTVAAVKQHRELITRHEEILRANESALAQNQAELERLRQAAISRHP